MRKILMALMALMLSVAAVTESTAQTYVVPRSATSVRAGGAWNNATNDNALRTWSDADMPLYTRRDTVRNAAGANDSAAVRLSGNYQNVQFQINATIDSGGANCDSVQVRVSATTQPGTGSGASYATVQTWTLTGVNTTEQVFLWPPVSAQVMNNPFTNYRVTVTVRDQVNTCRVSWQSWLLVR